MIGLRSLQLGVGSMLLHPLRSALTVLGIFIGVASVIWLLAIGEGISNKAQEQIARLGARNIIIRSLKPPAESVSGFGPISYGVTRADFKQMVRTLENVEGWLKIRELRRQFRYEGRLVDGRLVGCTPEYEAMTRLEMARGHFITPTELRDEKNHCVLSHETAERLFPFENPLDKAIRVDRDFYVVVGVVAPRAPTAGIGGSLAAEDFSSDVYVPIDTLWDRIGDFVMTARTGSFEGEVLELSQVTLQVSDIEQVRETAAVVERMLEERHELEDFAVVVPLELLEQARTMRIMFMLLLGLIAAISLVVGGIGIMNIMLATVTERTREIGIRRALGAKRRDITRQFLAETVVLSVVGGLLGILGGLACRPVVEQLRAALYETLPDVMQDLPDVIQTVTPSIVPWSIPLAFGISVAVGVLFGLYPAVRAAHMDPIEALRHQ